MTVTELLPSADLSEASFPWAVGKLGKVASEVELICPFAYAAYAGKIQEAFNCRLKLIPDEVWLNPDTWIVRAGDSYVWSRGA